MRSPERPQREVLGEEQPWSTRPWQHVQQRRPHTAHRHLPRLKHPHQPPCRTNRVLRPIGQRLRSMLGRQRFRSIGTWKLNRSKYPDSAFDTDGQNHHVNERLQGIHVSFLGQRVSGLCWKKQRLPARHGCNVHAMETTWQYVARPRPGNRSSSVELAAQLSCALADQRQHGLLGQRRVGLFGKRRRFCVRLPRVGQTASEYATLEPVERPPPCLNFRHACAVLDNGDLACWGEITGRSWALATTNSSSRWL